MRLLFVKQALVWPRASGHDVYCYYMMKALSELGAEVSLLTASPTTPEAVAGISLAYLGHLSDEVAKVRAAGGNGRPLPLTGLQERFRSFWGMSKDDIAAVRAVAERVGADVVIAFGLPTLPYLAGVPNAVRVWAMADEWVYHHLSLVRAFEPATWPHVRLAVLKGLYERAYTSLVDRVWVVSETDRRAARWFAGMKVSDLLPNGVDTNYFRPMSPAETPKSAIFWGRLDFEPNIDALLWFFKRVWPEVKARMPEAKFTIAGFQPTEAIQALARLPQVSLRANVPDLRALVCEHSLVTIPMVNSGGIKNKLLEGAAMGRAIVCTPHACRDLEPQGRLPFVQAEKPEDWVDTLAALWGDEARRRDLGGRARDWVCRYYTWQTPARGALEGFEASRRKGEGRSARVTRPR